MVANGDEPSPPPSGLTPHAKMVIGIGLAAFVVLSDFVPKGTTVHMIETAPGCTSLDNLSKFRQLVKEGGREAMSRMVDQNDCEALMKGSSVTVEDTSVWQLAECDRKAGETECLWTFLEIDRRSLSLKEGAAIERMLVTAVSTKLAQLGLLVGAEVGD